MVYETISDMFLDNRRGLEDNVKHLSEEDKENILCVYDWAVRQALETRKSYQIFEEEVKEFVGEIDYALIEQNCSKRFMEIGDACTTYCNNVENGRIVGYSAEVE